MSNVIEAVAGGYIPHGCSTLCVMSDGRFRPVRPGKIEMTYHRSRDVFGNYPALNEGDKFEILLPHMYVHVND